MKKIISLNPKQTSAVEEFPYDKDAFIPGNGRSVVFVEGTSVIDPLTITTSTALLPDRRVYVLFSETPESSDEFDTYAVHAIGEVVGVSKPHYHSERHYYCTVYLANLITLGFPNGPSFCNPLQTGLTKVNVVPRRFDLITKDVGVFFPARKLGWGNTKYGIIIDQLDPSAGDADEERIAYTLRTSADSRGTYHFLATPIGEVSVATGSAASDILHAEFQLTTASGTYRALAGYDFAVALDAELEVWWLSWKCQGGILSPCLYREEAVGDISRCRFVATPAAIVAPQN